MAAPARTHFLILLATTGLASAEFDFKQQVQPVLENQCVRCHNAEKAKGGLRLDTKAGFLKGGENGPVVVPGDLEKSEMIRRIKLPRGHEDLMPQEAEPLSGPHKNWLIEWVKTGAKWPDGVVLKVRKKEVPGLADVKLIPESAPKSLRDAAVVADKILARENSAIKGAQPRPAPAVDDTAFLRRVSVDLIGRIPTMDEITEFEKEPAATRRETLVDRLLAHPRFSERWTVFFADMLRIRSKAEGGSEMLAYVNRSLVERKPYDEMARELIATNGRPEQAPAAGFVLSDAANPMALAGATAQVFLGVRIGCAECHDHPFDDWKQKEFYELAAFFGQTKRVETGKNVKRIYTTENDETTVKWPPEREQPPKRDGVTPKFPFELISFKAKPQYISRLDERRKPAAPNSAIAKKELDDLVDAADPKAAIKASRTGADVLAEAAAAGHSLDYSRSIYRQSELRKQLASLVTDPRNPYFARAFVNRVWAELVGRGFVEPLDNFSAYNEMRHPQTLQFLAQEFTANGYDLRSLVKMIILTGAYQRGHLSAGATPAETARAEEAFTATRARRMLGEVLFDSVAAAGHVQEFKWPEGANRREVKRQIRIPLAPPAAVAAAEDADKGKDPAMMAMKPAMGAAPYDLEKGEKLDFDALLKQDGIVAKADGAATPEKVLADARKDLAMMKKQEEAAEEATRQARIRALQSGLAERFRLKTITEMVDDNPKFDSTLRMATPAPPSHFVRVFGQPSREGLGEFRDEAPSLRQELLMLNGKATHEASRVGPLEPISKLIADPKAKPDQAVEFAYLEILTRRPTAEELSEAREVIGTAANPAEGLADLRWALLNCHEFRYLP
jgi:hypothetical protein